MIGAGRNGDVVTLELRRHEKRNALNTELCDALRGAVADAAGQGARSIVITGEGTAFCAGADLSGDVYADRFPQALVAMLRTIDSVPVPVIAAVNGPAIGAGCQLAVACDLRVAAAEAEFAIPVAKLGLALDNWTVKRLAALIGGGPARGILMGVEHIRAERALQLGLANRLGDAQQAHEWALSIARLAPLSLQHLKLVFNDDGTLDPPDEEQVAAFKAAWTSEDMREARRARQEKRAPEFKGR